MSTFDFEEYRLPWETGPHWELKKEFMEKYKDDFSKDRLLCLAQAYSNMELLDCTYPDPVMQEVHELAKSLHVCKRLREASQKNEEENSSKKKKRRKRKLSSENSDNKRYFIQFCSATPEKISDALPDLNNTSSIDPDTSNATHKQENTNFVKANIAITGTTNASHEFLSERDDYFVLNIIRSPDFFDIKTLAHDIKGSSGSPIGRLENAVSKFGFDKVRFEFDSLPNSPGCLCRFYIRNTLMCIGKESTQKLARIIAAKYAVEILSNVENLPCKTLKDLKSYWVKEDDSFLSFHKGCCNKDGNLVSDSRSLKFWLNYAQKVKEKIGKCEPNFILDNTAKEFQTSIFVFAFGEDINSPMNNREFSCDLVLEKTIISQAFDKSKKKAKIKALTSGLACILDLLKWYEESIQKSNRNYIPDFSITKDSDTSSIVMDEVYESISKQGLSVKKTPEISSAQMSNENSVNVLSSKTEEKREAFSGPFRLNHWLLQNSIQRQLVICDTSEIYPSHSPASILQYSASFCQKVMTYETEQITLPSNENLYRYKVLFGREVMGCGESSTKNEARANAAANTIASLKTFVYTVKVKNELSDGFVINRSQVTDMEFSSNSIPENNVGCKLLKMMGWSGGAIGKGGLTEPITASDHHFHQGLGFSKKSENDEKYFKQKINALLKDFSESSSTGDLIFSTDFSKEERKAIHQMALRYNLVSTSRGKDKDRQLFIKRKMSVQELLHLIVQAGGSTSKYELLDCSK